MASIRPLSSAPGSASAYGLSFPLRDLRRRASAGFTLAEVVLSLGVTMFCTLTLIGLFTVGINTNMQANKETRAATIAQSLLVTRRAAPAKDLAAVQPRFPLPPMNQANVTPATGTFVLLDGNGLLTTDAATAQFGLTYVISVDPDRSGTQLRLTLHWPAQALPSQAAGRYELLSYFPPL